jgi:hypothetical protein
LRSRTYGHVSHEADECRCGIAIAERRSRSRSIDESKTIHCKQGIIGGAVSLEPLVSLAVFLLFGPPDAMYPSSYPGSEASDRPANLRSVMVDHGFYGGQTALYDIRSATGPAHWCKMLKIRRHDLLRVRRRVEKGSSEGSDAPALTIIVNPTREGRDMRSNPAPTVGILAAPCN